MKNRNILKLSALNLSIMLFLVLVFSNAFFKIQLIGGSVLMTAFGTTAILMSALVFAYGNIKLLTNRQPPLQIGMRDTDVNSLESCQAAVQQYIANNVKTYSDNLRTVISQINRMQKKKQTIKDMLLERFDESELSYEKFISAVEQIEKIMILNIKSLLSRINAFDEEEYENMLSDTRAAIGEKAERLKSARLYIYNEYKSYVEKSSDNNEEILLKLDNLILEITKLSTLNVDEVDALDAMVEIDTLIKDARWYRQ
ncbi:MAG: hypothetical protein FWH55_03305 [Oscillospiraceae bacterium]|nr:hypothetical protein [Oscillospiraceae bacterium]